MRRLARLIRTDGTLWFVPKWIGSVARNRLLTSGGILPWEIAGELIPAVRLRTAGLAVLIYALLTHMHGYFLFDCRKQHDAASTS
ncbi:hypothetical protein CAL21_22385 [Bordetella genomosp. 4]|nr:hypothetical protein CAL21_22385 [Bordetella genomosp. 4]